MDIVHRIQSCDNLTPADRTLIKTVFKMQDRIDGCTIEDLARKAHMSPASISRFCKKIGLKGFKEFKTELTRYGEQRLETAAVNIDYPFSKGDSPRTIAYGLKALYELTLSDAIACMDFAQLSRAARLANGAQQIGVFTHSHNAQVAESFRDRLHRLGKTALVPQSDEDQRITAAELTSHCVAIVISYSGRATFLASVMRILHIRRVPIIFIGTEEAIKLHPDIDLGLQISDREHPQLRISQFASHIALQFVLDVLFGCVFTMNYDQNMQHLAETAPLVDDRSFPQSAPTVETGLF
ncbi:MurR/RpiR family transcriptional regulator [Collinsella sp. An2]|uniref:MurR/RpiR family transcriptional regulator n=1 Tax=Collinsella sp. An2 TaxID=1965585 RepID=UPI000B3A3E5C|nr:MurR/RpiR family transcriptional regulator [Collinsella sp. An2]OUP11091.1 hypothetical protein B5F33_01570 [Collinsella sp. An2]